MVIETTIKVNHEIDLGISNADTRDIIKTSDGDEGSPKGGTNTKWRGM